MRISIYNFMTNQSENNDFELDAYLTNLYSRACKYEQVALELFDKAVACKPKNIKELIDFIDDPISNVDIWALSTKCVTYPKPLNVYVVGNGNGNADELINNIMKIKQCEKIPSYHNQLLLCAARKDLHGIKALVQYCGDDFNINYQDKFGLTALHIAVANKSGTKLINYLLDRALLNEKDLFDRTALYYAIATMRSEIVEMFLKKVTLQQINILDKFNMSPLCYLFDRASCDKIDDEFLKIKDSLVKSGAKYNMLYPFVDAFEQKFSDRFGQIKNCIYVSIESELQIVAVENNHLRNDIVDIATENDNLKKMVEKLHQNIDDIVETHQKQLSGIKKSQLSIDDCMRTISIQEDMIKNLTNKLNSKTIEKTDAFVYHAYPLDNTYMFNNCGYHPQRYVTSFNSRTSMNDIMPCKMIGDSRTEFTCHLSNFGKKN